MNLQPLPGRTHRIQLSPAACSLDIGDGSERSEYVSQDYMLNVLGRPHRAINMIYCYYPFDKGWPNRVSKVFKNKGRVVWGYPYDDYFPYLGGLNGDRSAEVFRQIEDIRRHGQDVTFTLTVDCRVSDDHIRAIARDLRPYGRLRLRINHECDGFWFAFNRRYSYEEVGRFFVRFSRIVREEAPNILMVSCWGSIPGYRCKKLLHEEALAPTLGAADVWSLDKYLSLHFAFPFQDCEPEDVKKTYTAVSDRNIWYLFATAHRRFCKLAGDDKGLEICELNCDGSVGGAENQSRRMERFYRRVLQVKPAFLKGITYYQFRDRGRLGLERENPNDITVGVPAPFLPVYRELMREPYFLPQENWTPQRGPLTLEWRASDDADGLGWKVPLKKKPLFLELLFGKKDNLIVRVGDEWYYKKPGVEMVDATPGARRWSSRTQPLPVTVLAPPADGTNPRNAASYHTRLSQPPQLRLVQNWGKHK